MMNKPKFVFFGTPFFAVKVLESLTARGILPVCVVVNPDRPAGRKKIITPPPVKEFIVRGGLADAITLLQPEAIDRSFADLLRSYKPDFFIVAAYARILPSFLLEVPARGAIGVHPSLLPSYRGPTPIQSAILSGDETTGVSLYVLDQKIDHGPVIASRSVPIGDKNYEELMDELAVAAGGLLHEVIPGFMKGELDPKAQDERKASYTKKFVSEDGFVQSALLAKAEAGDREAATFIYRKIRALNPEPGVFTRDAEGKRVKLLGAEVRGGKLRLTLIQKEGRKPEAANS